MMFDYDTIRIIWWAILGTVLIGFAIMDGFDMGIGILLPFMGKTDEERRVIINSIGPVWEGNQVWLVTAGAGLFAAWPTVYGVAFSGFYFALLLTLFALFFRPLGFDYRSKLPNKGWRSFWDWGLFVGAFVPALVFGVAFGNLLQGVPFNFDADLRVTYYGTLLGLLNPFALLAGIISLAMLVMHGAVFLQIRSDAVIYQRSKKMVIRAGIVLLIAFAVASIWVSRINGYHITSNIDPNAVSNPLLKTVAVSPGLWLDNYEHYPALWLTPLSVFLLSAATLVSSKFERPGLAFICSSLTIAAVILTAGISMFPFLLPSSLSPTSSLTVWDASSSQRTLNIMFWAMLIFLPVVIAYTSWVYRVLRGKLTVAIIRNNDHTLY